MKTRKLFLALFAFTLLSSRQKAAQARSKAGVMARSWQPAVCSQVQTSASVGFALLPLPGVVQVTAITSFG